MIEKLFALKLPPGLLNTGTAYQSKGRWRAGNCVRFTNGAIQPIGGWVQRTLTGATISGTPNAAISWQTNDGTQFLAIGTSSGLYVVTSGNVVYDITPTTLIADGLTHSWQLDTFGQYLIATFNEANGGARPFNLCYWNANIASIALPINYNIYSIVPTCVWGTVTTPERILFVLRGADLDLAGVTSGPFTPDPGRID